MNSADLYPLQFQPVFRRYLWGGRRLQTVLHKPIGPEPDYAESWEVVDRGDDQSVVANGPLAGTSLAALVQTRGAELLGKHHPQSRFPLLFKFLDAQHLLSVQVHPNDAQAAQMSAPDLGKTEAWVILDAAPGSYLYAGLRRGFDRAALAREVSRGTCELCLHRVEPRAGECYFIPAGTVHALGPGLLVAEIQQSSDTTFRLFDWNRVGADGKPRALHVEQSLDVTDFERGPVAAQVAQPLGGGGERLVSCPQFVLDRWRVAQQHELGGDQRCHLLIGIGGDGWLETVHGKLPLGLGNVVLLPASCPPVTLQPQSHGECVILDAYLP